MMRKMVAILFGMFTKPYMQISALDVVISPRAMFSSVVRLALLRSIVRILLDNQIAVL